MWLFFKQIQSKKRTWINYLNKKTGTRYTTYKEQRKLVKNLVIEAKQKSWNNFEEKLEEDSRSDQKLFLNVIKNFDKGEKTRTINIKDMDGELINNDKLIMEKWQQYFQELINPRNETNKCGDTQRRRPNNKR